MTSGAGTLRRHGGGLPWPEAREYARTAAQPLIAQRVGLSSACGRVLAADLVALTDLPVADASAMDGWAVAGSPPWRIVAELPAGQLLDHRLADGECAAIATGAVIPHGAVAVLPVERSLRDAAGVHPAGGATAPRTEAAGVGPTVGAALHTHIRRAGEEASRGDVLMPAGTVVTPQP